MGREIKFRAWDEDGFMFFPDKIEFNKTHTGDTRVWRKDIFGQDGSAVQLMQFTGLLDKLGKEIYEGDIVKRFCPCGECDNSWIGEIAYREPAFIFREHLDKQDSPIEMYAEEGGGMAVLEIIGNIYESPELLHD